MGMIAGLWKWDILYALIDNISIEYMIDHSRWEARTRAKFNAEIHPSPPPQTIAIFGDPIKTIGILTRVFCISDLNLVPLAWTGDELTHWGRVTHICVGKLSITGSYIGLSPGQRQAIIWTSAGILLNGPLGTNFSEILIGI